MPTAARCISSMEQPYKPPLKQKLRSIFKGALMGALCIVLTAVLANIIIPINQGKGLEGVLYNLQDSVLSLISIAFVGTTIWLLGLCVIALPLWIILEKLNIRSKQAAILLGIVVNAAISIPIYANPLNIKMSESYLIPISIIVIFSAFGGIVGWFIWRDAYSKAPITPASEATH